VTLLDLGGNSLKAVKLRLVGLHPAALIPDDILVGKFRDCLDFLHRWVLEDWALTVWIKLGM
jgi:hypothetical protein